MVNRWIGIGNLGRDPEVRYTSGGQAICSLRVACSRSWTDKVSGDRREETEWVDVEVWGRQAENCGEHLKKGRQVYVEGRLKTDRWQDKQTGQDRYRVKVVAENVRFIGGAGRGEGAPRRERADHGGEHDAPAGDGPPAGFSGVSQEEMDGRNAEGTAEDPIPF